jgi:hypothetical protein
MRRETSVARVRCVVQEDSEKNETSDILVPHMKEDSEDSDVPILPGEEEVSTMTDTGIVKEHPTARVEEVPGSNVSKPRIRSHLQWINHSSS